MFIRLGWGYSNSEPIMHIVKEVVVGFEKIGRAFYIKNFFKNV